MGWPMRKGSSISLAAIVAIVAGALLVSASTEPTVKVAPMDSVGPREVEDQTRTSIIRDYLAGWKAMDAAFSQNRPDLLDSAFVGKAREKLTGTIQEQQKLGIETSYQAESHDIKVVFYSPDGLSIQLLDNVVYEVNVKKQGQSIGTSHVSTRYVTVLSPTETKWKVRIFQGGTQ